MKKVWVAIVLSTLLNLSLLYLVAEQVAANRYWLGECAAKTHHHYEGT